MLFNKHSDLAGQHAFLSASKYHWTNYDDEKLDIVFRNAQAARRGDELHQFAHDAIRLGIKMPKTQKTLHRYINDAIGFRMSPEQTLYYSDNCFGHADAVGFHPPRGEKPAMLRIHDLKTGIIPANVRQLEIYAALFCLEYGYDPQELEIELRIYQSDEVLVYTADPVLIKEIMEKIVRFDKRIDSIRKEALL